MRRSFLLVVLIGGLAACHSGSHASPPPASTSSTVKPTPSIPKVDIVLDDTGLELPAGQTRAGKYLISFEDRRTHKPAGQLSIIPTPGSSTPVT